MPPLKKTMFREYDIRGRVTDEELNATTAEWIGRGFGTFLARRGIDPAYGSGPLATVVQDILSIVVYFMVLQAFGI